MWQSQSWFFKFNYGKLTILDNNVNSMRDSQYEQGLKQIWAKKVTIHKYSMEVIDILMQM